MNKLIGKVTKRRGRIGIILGEEEPSDGGRTLLVVGVTDGPDGYSIHQMRINAGVRKPIKVSEKTYPKGFVYAYERHIVNPN